MNEQPVDTYSPDVRASMVGTLIAAVFFAVWGGLLFGLPLSVAVSVIVDVPVFVIVPVLGGMILAGMLVWGYYRAQSVTFEIYENSVRKTYGVVTDNIEEMDTTNVDDVDYSEGLIDGLFGCGTITLQARGERRRVHDLKRPGRQRDIRALPTTRRLAWPGVRPDARGYFSVKILSEKAKANML